MSWERTPSIRTKRRMEVKMSSQKKRKERGGRRQREEEEGKRGKERRRRLTELDSQRSNQRSKEENSDPEERSDFGLGGFLDVPANATGHQQVSRRRTRRATARSTNETKRREVDSTHRRSLLMAKGLLKSLTKFATNNAVNPTIALQCTLRIPQNTGLPFLFFQASASSFSF